MPALFVAAKVIVLNPGVLKVTEGFKEVDVAGVPPENVRALESMTAFQEASENVIGQRK